MKAYLEDDLAVLSSPSEPEARAVAKVFRRLLWFLFVLYVVSYLDRINVGFAALSMNKALGLTATAFGLANTIFYVGYVCCEIPSNMLMVRFGARRWISRIMLTWGLISACTMFVWNTQSLYAMRFLLGIAEAGFLPGVLLYMTYWFPEKIRGRALAILIVAQPVAMAAGSAASGFILDMHGTLGLAGWRWLFLLEGLPAIFLGVAAYLYLSDGPDQAKWLDPSERGAIKAVLAREKVPPRAPRGLSIWRQLADRDVVLLCIAYFGLVNTLNANGTWTPQIIREVLAARSFSYVGLVSAVPALATILFTPLLGVSSDRFNERFWHTICAMMLAFCGWGLVAFSAQPEIRLLGLICSCSGSFGAMAIFWTIPSRVLSDAIKPAGIGLISSVGLTGSAVSPFVVGFLKDLTGTFGAGLLYVAALLALSSTLVALVWRGQRKGGALLSRATSGSQKASSVT